MTSPTGANPNLHAAIPRPRPVLAAEKSLRYAMTIVAVSLSAVFMIAMGRMEGELGLVDPPSPVSLA